VESSEGYSMITKRGGSIVVTSIVVSVLVIVGLFLCIIPGILFCYWYFFAVTIVVLEGASTGDSLKLSKQFATSHSAIGFIIILIIVNFIVTMVGQGIALALQLAFDAPFINAITSGLIGWVIAPYIYIATAFYYIRGKGMDRPAVPMQQHPGQYGAPPGYPVYPGTQAPRAAPQQPPQEPGESEAGEPDEGQNPDEPIY